MAEQHQPLSPYDQEFKNMHFLGSSNGWLIMLDNNSPSIFAVDPLETSNHVRVHFPSLMTFPDMLDFKGDEYVYRSNFIGEVNVKSSDIKNTFIKKVFLSKDPREEDCIAIAIFGETKRLAYCRVGDEEWTLLPQQDTVHGYEDVVFDKEGRIYAVNYEGIIIRFNILSWDCMYRPAVPDYSDGKYLVIDTKGRLLVVNRYIGWKNYDDVEVKDEKEEVISHDWVPYKTKRFKVLKLDEEVGELDEVYSLEDGVLFLRDNQSLCLSSTEFGRFKKDCIYFGDDSVLAYQEPRIGGRDFGVFDMKDGCVIPSS